MDAIDTGEPDEFARLLAQLNGTPAPEPVVAAPLAAAFVAPPAPAMPAPVDQAPVAPTPVAPAFGVAAPYPAGSAVAAPPVVPAITFPSVAPIPAAVPPVLPPLPRAPELMGADELAAPPRSLPPLYDSATPLVTPPPYEAPASYAAPPPEVAPPADPAPSPLGRPPTGVPAQPAPVAPPSGPAPAARPPLDFAALLATPVEGDDVSRAASAPLSFGSARSGDDDDDEPDLGRSTWGERIGLILAILLAPIGLIVGIVAAARSARRRGWVVGIVRASIAIAAVLTVVLAIGGYYGYTQIKQQQAHDQTATASAAFCAALKADPSMDQLPTFGWPAVAASIPDSLKAMQAYEDRWTKLAKVSPAGIKPGVTRVAAAAKKIIDSVTVARTVDDASNVAVISSVAGQSGVSAWHSEYCG